ncbi:hypothetical protein Ahia01_000820000, partial [Argonauta hians]
LKQSSQHSNPRGTLIRDSCPFVSYTKYNNAPTNSNMSRFIAILLVICSVLAFVMSAPTYLDDMEDTAVTHFITVEDLEKLANAARDLDNISSMVQRRKRSLSSILVQLNKKARNKSTTPRYSMY